MSAEENSDVFELSNSYLDIEEKVQHKANLK